MRRSFGNSHDVPLELKCGGAGEERLTSVWAAEMKAEKYFAKLDVQEKNSFQSRKFSPAPRACLFG
jgi:hypothetical protein